MSFILQICPLHNPKMKICYFIFLTVLGTILATPPQPEREPQNLYSILDKYIFDNEIHKFLDNCSLTGDDVMGAVEQVLDKAGKLDMKSTHVCEIIEQHFMAIMEPLTNLIDTSCNKNNNFGNIAKVSASTVQSVAAYICETSGKHLIELLHPCWRGDGTDEESDVQCIERVQREYESRMEAYMVNPNVLNFVCGSVEDVLDQCIKSKLNSRCTMQMTRDAFNGFFQALMSPCNEAL